MTKLNYIKNETSTWNSLNPITVAFHHKFYTCSIPSSQFNFLGNASQPANAIHVCTEHTQHTIQQYWRVHGRLSFSIHFFVSSSLLLPLLFFPALISCVVVEVQNNSSNMKETKKEKKRAHTHTRTHKLYSLTFVVLHTQTNIICFASSSKSNCNQ